MGSWKLPFHLIITKIIYLRTRAISFSGTIKEVRNYKFKQEIEFYGEDLQDFEISPFEIIETFHKRTLLHHHYYELTTEEKALLKEKDQFLLKSVKKVYEHMKKVYDFQNDRIQWKNGGGI